MHVPPRPPKPKRVATSSGRGPCETGKNRDANPVRITRGNDGKTLSSRPLAKTVTVRTTYRSRARVTKHGGGGGVVEIQTPVVRPVGARGTRFAVTATSRVTNGSGARASNTIVDE